MIKMFFVAFLYTFVVMSHATVLDSTSSLGGKMQVVHNVLDPYLKEKVNSFFDLAETMVSDTNEGIFLRCTAVVISPFTILGPAFCIYNENKNDYYKSVIAQISAQSYTLKPSIAHPVYMKKGKDYECYDIAVSKLNRSCDLQGATLPGLIDGFKFDVINTIIGMHMDSETMKWGLQVRTLDKVRCWNYLRFIVSMSSSDAARYLLCANQITSNKRIMKNNIGSPVIQDDVVIGIIAGTLYQNIPDEVLLIKLHEHLDFITETNNGLHVRQGSQSKDNRRTRSSSRKPASAAGITKKRCV